VLGNVTRYCGIVNINWHLLVREVEVDFEQTIKKPAKGILAGFLVPGKSPGLVGLKNLNF